MPGIWLVITFMGGPTPTWERFLSMEACSAVVAARVSAAAAARPGTSPAGQCILSKGQAPGVVPQ